VLIKHISQSLNNSGIEIRASPVITAERTYSVANLIRCVINIELDKLGRSVFWGQQGTYAVMNLTVDFEDRRASTIVDGSVYVCTHRRESKKAIVLPDGPHKLVRSSATIEPGKRSQRFWPRWEWRYDNLASSTAFVIDDIL